MNRLNKCESAVFVICRFSISEGSVLLDYDLGQTYMSLLFHGKLIYGWKVRFVFKKYMGGWPERGSLHIILNKRAR